MNSKIKITSIFIILLIGVLSVSCRQQKNNSQQNNTDASWSKGAGFDSIYLSTLKLTLTRGAFHWDTLELKGNELTYFPSTEGFIDDDYPDYQVKSTVILDNKVCLLYTSPSPRD